MQSMRREERQTTAGGGTEWDSNWKFFPRQAKAVSPREISVELTSDEGVVGHIQYLSGVSQHRAGQLF